MMKNCVATVGTFDGVHLGHRLVIERLLDEAHRLAATPLVFTFTNHPLSLIAPQRAPLRLSDPDEEQRLLRQYGTEVVMLDFDERLRSMSAGEWLRAMHEKYGVQLIVMGYDNTFGCDGIDLSVEDYKAIGRECGVQVVVADKLDGVSSSAIRRHVMQGNLEAAAEALGRRYTVSGIVVGGEALGRRIGFPTANVRPPAGRLLPPPGVYAAYAYLGNAQPVKSVVNIGTRPTVSDAGNTTIEAHLLDWDGSIYGRSITLAFVSRLRDEKKFDSVDALKNQIADDCSAARALL